MAIEPEEYEPGICAGEAIDDEVVRLGLSEEDMWSIWKLGLELRGLIEKGICNAQFVTKYEEPKVVDAWVEDGGVYAIVDAKGWVENLGFRVEIIVEERHTDEPASERK